MPKPDLVAEVRQRHYSVDMRDAGGHDYCNNCLQIAPCDAIDLADEAERLRDDLRVSASAINKQIEVDQGLREALRSALNQMEINEWSGSYDSCPSCRKTDPAKMEDYRRGQPNNNQFDESAFGHSWSFGTCPVQRAIEEARAALEGSDAEG